MKKRYVPSTWVANAILIASILAGAAWWLFDVLYKNELVIVHIAMFSALVGMGIITRHFMLRSFQDKDSIAEQKELLSAILDTLPSAIYVFDEDDHCLAANRQAAADIGVKQSSLIGKHAHGITNLRAIATEGRRYITNEFGLVGPLGNKTGRVIMFLPDTFTENDTKALDHKNVPKLKSPAHDIWHKEKTAIREELQRIAKELGHTPTAEDIQDSSAQKRLSNINFHYGNLNAALIDAGLTPLSAKRGWKRIFHR